LHRRATILTSTAVLALLAGCGGTPAADGSGGATAPSKAPAKVGLADYLVGSWTVDPASLDEVVKSQLPSDATSPEITYTGSSTTTFAKGGTFTTADNLTMVLKATENGKAYVVSRVTTGEEKGTWKVDGVTLTLTITEDGLKTTASVQVDGEVGRPTMDTIADLSDGVLPLVPTSATCDATTLTLTSVPSAASPSAGQTPSASASAQFVLKYKRA
jgi:hypothetical protein